MKLGFGMRCAAAAVLVAACEGGGGGTGPVDAGMEIGFAKDGVLHVVDAASTPATAARRLSPADNAYEPSFSPDGRFAAVNRQTQLGPAQWDYQVVIVDTRTGAERRLTTGPDDHFGAAWSPDGTRIAYMGRAKGTGTPTRLYVAQANGTQARQLGTAAYFVRRPSWSPNAQQLAATTAGLQIVIVEAATGAQVRQVTSDGLSHSPAWSPDGATIAYSGFGPRGDGTIWLTDVNGSARRVLTDSLDFQPAWSPDGRMLAFASNRRGSLDIFIIRPDGTGLKQVTGPGQDVEPAWRRVP